MAEFWNFHGSAFVRALVVAGSFARWRIGYRMRQGSRANPLLDVERIPADRAPLSKAQLPRKLTKLDERVDGGFRLASKITDLTPVEAKFPF